MVKIRLLRIGAKKQPKYRIVAADEQKKRDGAFIEMLGSYNLMSEPPEIVLKRDRYEYWISVGAQPTKSVHDLVMKKLVEFLAKNIATQPEKVVVEETTNESHQVIQLSVASEDMGKVIGKSGRIIKAIRTLLKIKAVKEGKRAYLELTDQNQPNA